MVGSPLGRLLRGTICTECLARSVQPTTSTNLYRSSFHTKRKLQVSVLPDGFTRRHVSAIQTGFIQDYFSANGNIDREWLQAGFSELARANTRSQPDTSTNRMVSTASESQNSTLTPEKPERIPIAPHTVASMQETNVEIPLSGKQELLPHRRRKRRKEEDSHDVSEQLPLDASSQLTTAATSLPTSATLRRRFATYLALTKPRLSFLILLTTTSAYSLYPLPEILSSSSAVLPATTLSTSTLTLLFLTSGTFLSCAAANTLNMLFEPKYDALMTRTRNRPLVRRLITPRSAGVFAAFCAATGLTLLYVGTNPTVAGLSALNIFLYAGVYTPLKRISPINTWVGAIVGGIPPLMGWCAAAGQAATAEHHSASDLLFSEPAVGGWLLAALLFAWQFPHFMSLSHTIREDYKAAGHKMLAWTNPARNARVALRYSLAMFPICTGLYAIGLVNQGFLVVSTACNLWMTKEAVAFWRKQGGGGSARGLFWASVWQLPLVLVGALVCKSSLWDGVFGDSEDARSAYDPASSDGEGKVAVLAGEVMTLEERNRQHNMAMMGFKRPT